MPELCLSCHARRAWLCIVEEHEMVQARGPELLAWDGAHGASVDSLETLETSLARTNR